MMLGMDQQSVDVVDKPKTGDDAPESDSLLSKRASVKEWQQKIKKAKDKKWKADFDRMKENMDFVAGIQWDGQQTIRYKKIIVNMTLRAVNQGVAMLYAKNPKVEASPRKKLRYQLWDGNVETAQMVAMTAQQMQMANVPLPPDMIALIQDILRGRQEEMLIKKVCLTMDHIFQYQMDEQQPSFKLQMKQLVRRVRTCGVGYIKVSFCRDYDQPKLTQSETRLNVIDRLKAAESIIKKLQDGKLQETDAEVQKLQSLINSLNVPPDDPEATSVREHLVLDFPAATSIIVDPNCRILKGFIGAHWVVEEFCYPIDFVNAMFGTDIKPGGDLKTFDEDGRSLPQEGGTGVDKQESGKRKIRLWQVYNLDDKSTFIICEGYKDYVQEPQPVDPCPKGFWTIFPVTFNDIEVEEGCKATIFPPSDVDLLMPVQKERNRVRQALRRHRIANGPKYVYPEGVLSQTDKDNIENAEDQSFFGLTGIPPGQEPSKILQPLNMVDIKPELYETQGLQEDALLASGQQEANLGPAQPNVTATVGTIAEQSRMSVAASDVDGLDDALTEVAQCGAEMILREMSRETVERIAGRGAVFPEVNRQDFLNEIEMRVVAASSGRPNKAIDIANWERIAPILIQAMANPQAIIRETVRRADDQLDPADFFPLNIPQFGPPPESPTNGNAKQPTPSGGNRNRRQIGQGGPQQPLQPTQAGVAVPFVGTP